MRIPRSTAAISGLLIIVLGIWGGIVPFIGPYFHYSFAPGTSWHFTTNRLWLSVLPGAAAVVGGFMLVVTADRVRGTLGAWLAMLGGGWFVVGPAVSRVWEHTTGPIGAPLYGSVRQMAEIIGYFAGVGAVIVALAGFALGRIVTRPARVTQSAPVTTVGGPAAVEPDDEPAPAVRPTDGPGDEPAVVERGTGPDAVTGESSAHEPTDDTRRR